MIITRWLPSLLGFTLFFSAGLTAQQTVSDADFNADRELRHQSADWLTIAAHLPDPAIATPGSLEGAADVLRARRLPEDALDYYRYAILRGGEEEPLWNKIGVTQLELRNTPGARAAFQRALQLKKSDSKAWNNLGSAEFVSGDLRGALADYMKAVKLSKKTAVFHSNLGSAYFELKDYESARNEFQRAVKLDKNVFHDGGWSGSSAHVMSLTDGGRFSFEMAKIAARQRDDATVLHDLGRACESGFDIVSEMSGDRDFQAYWKDPRVATIVRNAKAMRARQVASAGTISPLPEAKKPDTKP